MQSLQVEWIVQLLFLTKSRVKSMNLQPFFQDLYLTIWLAAFNLNLLKKTRVHYPFKAFERLAQKCSNWKFLIQDSAKIESS